VVFDIPYIIGYISTYPKNEKDNLSKAERNAIARMIVRQEQGLKGQENSK
jgi:hypothetical protein